MAQLKSTVVQGNLTVTGKIIGDVQSSGGTSMGSVTSVGMTVPTGLTVSGSPITASGILAVSLTSGYTIPLAADVTKGVTAHGWGNHADQGYSKFSGSYDDLTNKPTIPTKTSQLTNDSGFITSVGTPDYAKFLYPQDSATSSGASSWTASSVGSNWKRGWSQKFVHSSISSDSGDINFWLRPGVYASTGTELSIVIDGDYYGQTGTQRLAYVNEIPTKTSQLTNDSGYKTTDNDTKNTAGATNSTSGPLYLIGALGQTDNPQTYSNSNVSMKNGALTAVSYNINGKATWQYNSSTDCIELVW